MNTVARHLTGLLPLLAIAQAQAHDVSAAARQKMLDGSYFDFAWVGAEHMLTGYDHLLFLLGVLFFLKRFSDIVWFITVFTAGHTLSLIVATSTGISANPYLVDAVIALTVMYKAFENLDGFKRWFGFPAPSLSLMVFLFGVIHGFGLSTRLQQMTLARDPQLISKILAFNVGVELGQVLALALMVGVIRLWQGTPAWRRVSLAANSLLIAAGAVLLVQQLHGYWSSREAAVMSSAAACIVGPAVACPTMPPHLSKGVPV